MDSASLKYNLAPLANRQCSVLRHSKRALLSIYVHPPPVTEGTPISESTAPPSIFTPFVFTVFDTFTFPPLTFVLPRAQIPHLSIPKVLTVISPPEKSNKPLLKIPVPPVPEGLSAFTLILPPRHLT